MEEDDSINSSAYSDDSSTSSTDDDAAQQEEQSSLLKSDDDSSATKVRLIVTIALIAASFAVCIPFAFASLNWQDEGFHEDFQTAAGQLLDHIGDRSHQNIDSIASFGTSVTSSSSQQSEWPFVTIPNYEIQGMSTLDSLESTTTSSKILLSPYVTSDDREEWERYSNGKQRAALNGQRNLQEDELDNNNNQDTSPFIFKVINGNEQVIDIGPGPFYPVWQIAPSLHTSAIKFNLRSLPSIAQAMDHATQQGQAVITAPLTDEEQETLHYVDLLAQGDDDQREPVSLLVLPIFDSFLEESSNTKRQVVSVSVAPFLWKSILANGGASRITAVVENKCQAGTAFTYEMDEQGNAVFVGDSDLHTTYYSDLEVSSSLPILLKESKFVRTTDGISFSNTYCPFTVKVYPTAVFMNTHTTNQAVVVTALVVTIFGFIFLLFLFYGGYMQARLDVLSKKATQSRKLVNTLFPKEVQERMFKAGGEHAALLQGKEQQPQDDPFARVTEFLKDAKVENDDVPIADLWTDCTVLFADIKGFTAWSACRSPTEVFTLLETLYKAFDRDAKRRGVFKVETIGDCYVAVCGLPTPNKDHAIVMTRFARDCRHVMAKLTRQLEVTLGPDTGDLELRIGLNSGPVTAGVLRGDKGRFQLFGDTVNTASRMESNGVASKIHASGTTAELLIAAGKAHWVTEREELIEAKGKGKLQTYFLEPVASTSTTTSSVTPSASSVSDGIQDDRHFLDEKCLRLVDWNVEVLSRLLRQVVTRRKASKQKNNSPSIAEVNNGANTIDEFKEVVELLEFEDGSPGSTKEEELSEAVMDQLRDYISMVGNMYHGSNPFHNFEHASHVTMSVIKLLSRIVAPTSIEKRMEQHPSSLHDKSYGLASDPLTQFACVFAALIHDVDHPGVPNSQLVKENSPLAKVYKNKSVAEQNSVDIAWDLLQQGMFNDLRETICATEQERRHFRQLVVNSVMSTDIMDKDLKALRNSRWEKAFSQDDSSKENVNRKATIVIEHMIQASDVAHTMQHWHIYRKWNERLFMEMYKAFMTGRAEQDPSLSWYKGEMGFFDFYIIPLAKKLKDCGVFGVSSAEYLNYAEKNRQEWEERGQAIVEEMIEKATRVDNL